MIERGIRGGISMIINRYGKSNNRCMGIKYDASKPSKYITYLDANNLYGWAMSNPLPIDGFEWMNKEELEKWRNYGSMHFGGRFGIPEELHDIHNDYPLTRERIKMNKVDKLIPNLWN